MVPESNHEKALRCEPISAESIIFDALRRVVLTAVELNNQPSLKTNEIHDVFVNRKLAPKAVAADLFSAQLGPEPRFSFGEVLSEFSGFIAEHFLFTKKYTPLSPHPNPPPQGGRGLLLIVR